MAARYAEVSDLVARFSEHEIMQLTDRERMGVVDADVANIALDDATAEINSYLGRYKLPFAQTPAILVRLCCDIARYRLSSAGNVNITDEIKNRYKIDVLKLLDALGRGDVSLGVDNLGEEVETENTVQFVNNKNRIFARDANSN